MSDESKLAFPRPGSNGWEGVDGMTYREWLIGQALAGLCANPAIVDAAPHRVSTWALDQVDNVLKKLQKEKEETA